MQPVFNDDPFFEMIGLTGTGTGEIEAVGLQNQCRSKGVQVGTIDALIAQLDLHYDISVLTTTGAISLVVKESADQ